MTEEWILRGMPENYIEEDELIVVIQVEIRDNTTGEIREYEDFILLKSPDNTPNASIWETGNYSCDCIRSAFFKLAGNEPIIEDINCTDGLYSVNLKNKLTGRVFYKEFETKEIHGK